VSGTYDPEFSLMTLSGDKLTVTETKKLPYPYPEHISVVRRAGEQPYRLIITHLRDLESLKGAISEVTLSPENLSVLGIEKIAHLPSSGRMSLYLETPARIFTVCRKPGGLCMTAR
jgi:hypothetical protein